jgi:predicted RNA-binding protein
MAAYIDLFTPETWKAFVDRGGGVTGFRQSQKTAASKIKPGDLFLAYLVGVSRWVGLLKVTSEIYVDSSSYFKESDDPFVIRFKVDPLVVLEPVYGIPVKHLWHKLSICERIDPNSMGWPYKIGVARSLGEVPERDTEQLIQALQEQKNRKQVFELSSSDAKRLEGKRLVALETASAVVEIPPSTSEEAAEATQLVPANTVHQYQAPYAEARRSIRIQARLAKIGMELGFKIWIPANDEAAVLRELGNSVGDNFLSKLPLNADDNTVDTVERIDVLWVKGRSIVRAFEVEDTTSVYSGILRMSDLIALQPQFRIKLHIVAPEERRDKVRQQILRPTFTYMEGGPLASICTFLSYGAVDELATKPDLRFMRDEIVEEYEEVME